MRRRKPVSEVALAVVDSDALQRGAPTWEDAVTLFLEGWKSSRPNVRERTLQHYEEQLRSRLLVFAEERGIASPVEFTRNTLRGFVAWLSEVVTSQGKGLTQRGKQMALGTAKTFFRYYAVEEIMPDITQGVESFRLDRRFPEHLTGEQLGRLFGSFRLEPGDDRGSYEFARDRCMVVLLALCGLRVSEVVNLNRADLDLETRRVRVQLSKTHRARNVDLPSEIHDGKQVTQPQIAEAFDLWLKLRDDQFPNLKDDGALFVTLQDYTPRTKAKRGEEWKRKDVVPRGTRITDNAVRLMLRRAAVRAGLSPKATMPHALRHTFGVLSAMAKVPPTAIRDALGHTTLSTTALYMALTDEERSQAYATANIAGGVLGHGRGHTHRRAVSTVLDEIRKK